MLDKRGSFYAITVGALIDSGITNIYQIALFALFKLSHAPSDFFWRGSTFARLIIGFSMALGIGSTCIGGYIATALSAKNKIRNAVIVGVIGLCFSLIESWSDNQLSMWWQQIQALFLIPAALFGSYLNIKKKAAVA